MKLNRSILTTFALLIIVAALYRVIPVRPWGFAPHIAMAVFGGAVINDKKWAFALPVFSMFLSDVLYEVLYSFGISDVQGFYEGQFTNYVLFALLTFIGFAIRNINVRSVLTASVVAPSAFFLVSNFFVWVTGSGFQRPKTFGGLIQCYADGLPFYPGSLAATVVFSVLLFGGYRLLTTRKPGMAFSE